MICNTKKLLDHAYKNNYAVPAFNIHNLETMRACVEAAYELRSPVILAFTPKTMLLTKPEYLIAIANTASEIYDIPIALHLDHFKKIVQIKQVLELGVKSVMFDNSALPLSENIANTAQVVKLARKYDATVEGEVGKLQRVNNNEVVEEGDSKAHSNPDEVVEYITQTKVDSCAIAFGNIHGQYLKPPVLDYSLLTKIKTKLEAKKIFNFPFVLHGGSGLSEEQLKNCINHKIIKLNIGSELKPVFANGLRAGLKDNVSNDPRDFLVKPTADLKEFIKTKIRFCNSFNKY